MDGKENLLKSEHNWAVQLHLPRTLVAFPNGCGFGLFERDGADRGFHLGLRALRGRLTHELRD